MFNKEKSVDFENWAQLIFRLGFGFFFFFTGLQKLITLLGGENPLGFFGITVWLAWIVCAIEVIGGLLLVLGLFRYFAGKGIAVIMVVAVVYQVMGALKGDGGTINLLKILFQHLIYIGGALWLAFTRNDFATLDAVFRKKK